MNNPALANIPDTITFTANANSQVPDTTDIFDAGVSAPQPRPVPGRPGELYIPFGHDNRQPYELIEKVAGDEVTAENKLFNVLTCYGAGLEWKRDNESTELEADLKQWTRRQNLPLYFLEQATDMKYFFFSVAVIILDHAGKRINKLRHKEAAYIRLAKADTNGRIPYVYSAPWNSSSLRPENIERIPLLDIYDPLGDLLVRLGHERNDRGRRQNPTKDRKFAILMRFPTPGSTYYPTPYWTAIFRGGSYDEKRLISVGKRAKLRNHTSMKYQVEIHREYWERICRDEYITEPDKMLERIRKEKENIRAFLSGIENSDKVWISGFYVDPTGTEVHDVQIKLLEGKKEGGDWNEDIQATANTICYGDNIHPNLVGATPGKSQQNNSGSDKRELFTMKQALEVAYHDILLTPLRLVAEFHQWQAQPTVPMIQLTTLDEHRDSKKVNPSNPTL